MKTLPLSAVLDDPANSFNVVRLFAALCVVVSHSFMLVSGSLDARPLSWGPYELGANAVNVFFFVSGLMLSRSYDLQPHWLRFTAARLLRIFPALIVSGVVVAWVLVPISLGRIDLGYLLDSHTLLYPLNITFMFEDARIHGAFLTSSFPEDLNVPLWTIKFELLAYLFFGLASAVGLFKSRLFTLLLCVAFGILLTYVRAFDLFYETFLGSTIRLGFCFLLGVNAYRWRASIRLRPIVALLVVVLAAPLGFTILGPVVWIVALSYGALAVASLRIPVLTAATNHSDASFGVYIYSWPVQQVLLGSSWSSGTAWAHLTYSIMLALPIALLSWTFVERPALRLKALFARPGGSRSHLLRLEPKGETSPPTNSARLAGESW